MFNYHKSFNDFKAVLLIPIFFFFLANFYQCHLVKNDAQQNFGGIIPTQQDTTIIIHDKYLISFPKTYTVYSGKGDDSEFVQIINPNGRIILNYESGVENNSHVTFTFEKVKEKFKDLQRIVKIKDNVIWMALNTTENTFRNIEGIILIEESHINVSKILNIECNSKDLKEVNRIISTIQFI